MIKFNFWIVLLVLWFESYNFLTPIKCAKSGFLSSWLKSFFNLTQIILFARDSNHKGIYTYFSVSSPTHKKNKNFNILYNTTLTPRLKFFSYSTSSTHHVCVFNFSTLWVWDLLRGWSLGSNILWIFYISHWKINLFLLCSKHLQSSLEKIKVFFSPRKLR